MGGAFEIDAPPAAGAVTTRLATDEEWERYGIRRPLRQDLVAALNDGLSISAIAELYAVTTAEVAGKILTGWHGIRRALTEQGLEHARHLWPAERRILGAGLPTPPLAGMALEMDDEPDPDSEPEERENPMPRRDEELRRVLPPDVLAQELQENTVVQVARKYKRPQATIRGLMTEYRITARGVRRAVAAKEERAAPPAPDHTPQKKQTWNPRVISTGSPAPMPPRESQPPQAKPVDPPVQIPLGLTIRVGERLHATVNDQNFAVSDVLPHLRAVEAILITATAAGRRVNLTLKVEEVAS